MEMSADNKNSLNFLKLLPVCPVHIVVIADNVHVSRLQCTSIAVHITVNCNTVQCVHMPISTSESWFTFNHARIFSDLSIRLRLPTVSIPQTENHLSTNACRGD